MHDTNISILKQTFTPSPFNKVGNDTFPLSVKCIGILALVNFYSPHPKTLPSHAILGISSPKCFCLFLFNNAPLLPTLCNGITFYGFAT